MNHEDISALADDEIDVAHCAAMLDQLGDDAAARRTWARYHLIGDVLRGEGVAGASRASTVVELPTRTPARRLPLAGLAIAASVAAISVVLVAGNHSADVNPQMAAATAAVAAGPAPLPAATTTVDSIGDADVSGLVPAGAYDQRLNGYLVNFNEQRARLGVPGVHPYVRIVGFESR